MAKIDAYRLSDGITKKFRARPSGINPADGKRWPNRSFDTWAQADRYQRYPAGGGEVEPPTALTDCADAVVAGLPVAAGPVVLLTLADYIDQWLQRHNGGGQPTSQRSRASHMRAVKVSEFGGRLLHEITPGDVRAHVNGVTATGKSASLAEGRLTAIRAVLDTAVEEDLLAGNPARMRGVKAPRSSKAPRGRAITREQFDCARKSLPEWIRPAAILAVYCGLRAGEVCGLRWESVNLDAGRIRIQDVVLENGTVRDHPKGYKTVTIPLQPPVVDVLRAHRDAYPGKRGQHVFREPGKGRPFVNPHRLRDLWAAARKAAWIDDDAPARFHDLRHMFANDLIGRNVPPVKVMQLMRHESLNTTMHYIDDPELNDLASVMNSTPIAS